MRRSTIALVLSCGAFAVAGAVSRLIFVSIHSRFQIAAFCVAAGLLQLAAPDLFARSQSKAVRFAFVWNAAAASLAIVLTRLALEGLPYRLALILNTIRA